MLLIDMIHFAIPEILVADGFQSGYGLSCDVTRTLYRSFSGANFFGVSSVDGLSPPAFII